MYWAKCNIINLFNVSFIFLMVVLNQSTAINDNSSISDVSLSSGSPDSQLTVIRAENIIKQIKDEKDVEYDRVRIEGELNLSSLDIKNSISIRDSFISEFTNFSHTTFEDYINFESTIFQDDATFQRAHFKDVTFFTRAQFQEAAYFSETQFDEEANFNMAKFIGPLYFYNSQFMKYSNFRESTFNDLAFFWLTRFFGGADFTKTTFDKKAYFVSTIFSGQYDSGKLTYYDVQRMHRGGPMIFGGFQGCANFEESVFNDLAYFSDAYFIGDVTLENAKIYSMDLEDAVFEEGSRLYLNGTSFVRLIVPTWNLLKDHLIFDGSVYLSLIKNYKDLQRFDDADDCYYDLRAKTHTGLLDTLAYLSCGYGVRPIVPLFALGVLMLIGGLLLIPAYGLINGFYFSAATVLSIPTEFKPIGYYRILVVVEKFLGYLLLALFLVTLGNVMIR